ncbi:DUF1420 family protein [Leptospira noguchii]|uniref:DUF1420 family protein n=1 Tax=Leptospira noguchii TaxID=28182 RepID=UPI001146FB8C|nr:DUF1420 family protein [Leptospira noguchii]TQE83102.1 DUF1420 domain-containing protein [Leptospira noguchii]UOG35793.1 DUF1420 domain-containing protein [Leptospira noguchii]UOG46728.1 DUF1420 domain-containing protein [Leptospira noguchii]UOG54414.1 DUF1420 domain-containing protein [Leptospira noguchii]
MKFGLDANVAYPPLSVLYSIFLIFGCDFLGFYILKLFENSLGQIKNSWIRWQAPLTGALLFSIILYPLSLFGYTPRFLMKGTAIFLSVLGFINVFFFVKDGIKNLISIGYCSNIFKSFKNNSSIEKNGNNKKYVKGFFLFKAIDHFKNKLNSIEINYVLNGFIILLIIGYALLALCPITNADSLDYHIGVAIEILNQGKMPIFLGWFHGRLAGSGEVLNALGLAIGAEQFGSLLQFSGLLGIYGILSFYTFSKEISESNPTWRRILVISFLTSPVLVFLVSSPKPQLLQIGMTSFAITLLLEIFSNIKTDKNKLFAFSLICILIMSATQAKFSFFLSAFLIGFFSIIFLGSIRLFFYGLLISIFFFTVIVFPSIFWKMKNYNSTLIDVLIHPLPGNVFPGINKFEASLRNYQDSTLIFPLSLIFPNQFGVITTVIGMGLFLVIFLKPIVTQKTFLLNLLIILFVILGSLMGQKASRFFLEPFVWILISLISFNNTLKKLNLPLAKKILGTGILLQACVTLSIIAVGIYQLFPGIFSISLREKVMNQYANGYNLMKWVDLTLPREAVLLSHHRSIALSARKTLSLDWIPFMDFNSADMTSCLRQIKDENVTHILMFGDKIENSRFSGCLGKTIGKTKSYIAVRNPLGQKDFFISSLVEFQSSKLPKCINSK